jgi:hypothetical protein
LERRRDADDGAEGNQDGCRSEIGVKQTRLIQMTGLIPPRF